MTDLRSPLQHDRVLIALGGAALALSVLVAAMGSLQLLPSPFVALVILGVAAVALRIAMVLRARRSPALTNPRILSIVSLALLGMSLLAAIATLARALDGHSVLTFGTDLGLHLVVLVTVLILAIPARTVGWRQLLGLVLCGILATSVLARLLGTPVVDRLGPFDPFAVSFWVPVTEETVKALPVAVFALLMMRHRAARPSAVDFALLGVATGTGFALIENAEYGRSVGSWDAALPFSAILPSISQIGILDQAQAIAGHAVWTGAIGLAIGIGVLYSRRVRLAWVVIPVVFVIAVVEHGIANAEQPPVFVTTITAHGLLATGFLVAGMLVMGIIERRPVRGIGALRAGILLTPPGIHAHRQRLAELQRSRRVMDAVSTQAEVAR